MNILCIYTLPTFLNQAKINIYTSEYSLKTSEQELLIIWTERLELTPIYASRVARVLTRLGLSIWLPHIFYTQFGLVQVVCNRQVCEKRDKFSKNATLGQTQRKKVKQCDIFVRSIFFFFLGEMLQIHH